MAKRKISIYLIKSGYEIDRVVDCVGRHIDRHVLHDGSLVFIKISDPHKPSWVEYFNDQVESDFLLSSSASALHLVSVGVANGLERVFAISFGYGYTLLNNEAIEERFGLRVALNQATDGNLRKLKRTAISGNARKTDEQMPLPSSVDAFEIDVERDLLEGVTIGGGDGLLARGSITGSDSLSLSVDESAESITDFLKKVYSVYRLDSYKRKYAWVDRIVPVRDPSLQEYLNNKSIELMNAFDQNIWLAVPEVLEWEAIAGFRVGCHGPLLDDVCIDTVYPTPEDIPQSYEGLRKTRISVINQASGSVVNTWSASDCLYGEIEYEGNSYCANNGNWYLIDANYKASIEARYEDIPLYLEPLPDYRSGEHEGPYNQRVVKMAPASKLLLDRKTIYYGSRGSQVELCDILCKNGSFIHVKYYSGSSNLSHLFNQGLVSAKLVKSDASFRSAAQEKINSIEPNGFILDRNSIKQVVFAIISKHGHARPEIPFFSKVALDSVCSDLTAMGIDIAMARIRENPACVA
ncbi:DUF6119 family protein [Collinsella stercoris]|uniref:DUF6119 family protein n=1 Tax=Collinsella stercoris TaxID=147206 RepID=UPI003AEFC6A8